MMHQDRGARSVIRRIALQERRRLLRDGLELVLGNEPDFEVVAAVPDPGRLVDQCVERRPDVALIELDTDAWDVGQLIRSLRRRMRTLQIVGLTDRVTRQHVRLTRDGLHGALTRADGLTGIVAGLRGLPGTAALSWLDLADVADEAPRPALGPDLAPSLTGREREVIVLIGEGLTTREISDRLAISPKTVENHKQRVYGKLGVNNQAHAVSIALRTGLVRPTLRAGSA